MSDCNDCHAALVDAGKAIIEALPSKEHGELFITMLEIVYVLGVEHGRHEANSETRAELSDALRRRQEANGPWPQPTLEDEAIGRIAA